MVAEMQGGPSTRQSRGWQVTLVGSEGASRRGQQVELFLILNAGY